MPLTDHLLRRARRRGYSLLELVIVVVILGVIAALAAPRLAMSAESKRVHFAAKRLAADLGTARASAMASSSPRTITISAAEGKYSISSVSDIDRMGMQYSVNLARDPYGVVIDSVTAGDAGVIVFSPSGGVSRGGTIVLRRGDERRNIVIDPTTGKARVK
ncbi:MAG: GspH/FimT family pseudopilin [Phycisphaeraceae bacterium]|nr:GspH/FimT family pseudopilin [Phycisphaeraceae bacterium]